MNLPISEANSIESITFVLVFERVFNKQEFQHLLRLENELKKDLPSFKQINGVGFRFEGGQVTPIASSQEITGILLQCFQSNGKPSIELKIESNIIEVTCFSYDRWEIVWKKAKSFLLEVIKSVDNDDNRLVICLLKVIDKFVYEGSCENYNVFNVFSENTQYLTKNIQHNKEMRLWHIFQGWFENSDVILNNLNINTSDANGKILTTIEHEIRHQFIKNPQIISNVKNKLDSIFSSLHEKNKAVIRALLNEEQLKRIGLCNHH